MKTLVLTEEIEDIKKAGQIIKDGGLVAFPTETVYGLGADGLAADAVRKVYLAKGRPSDNPMILHIWQIEDVYRIAEEVRDEHMKLMKAFWPGPMTVVMKKKECVPAETAGGLDTVGIRLPDHETARRLIKESGTAIAAPSANLSGKPSPTRYSHVLDDLDGRIDAVIAGGDCHFGIESTVLTVRDGKVIILRPGAITPEMIKKETGLDVEFDPALKQNPADDEDFRPMAPGMKYRHYAPEGKMVIYSGDEEKVREAIEERKAQLESSGTRVGVIWFGSRDFETAAHDLFDRLRKMDADHVEYILAGALDDDGLGFSVMNRMMKSAGYNIVQV